MRIAFGHPLAKWQQQEQQKVDKVLPVPTERTFPVSESCATTCAMGEFEMTIMSVYQEITHENILHKDTCDRKN